MSRGNALSQAAVVVPVGEFQPQCVIVMPFDPNLEGVFFAVQTAANGLDLNPWRADLRQNGSEFWHEICKKIRSARIVVAVCHVQANISNVMCELGVALALGKRTLILTTDPNVLPSNIRHFQSLQYQPGQDPTGLAVKVEKEMRSVLSAPPLDSSISQTGSDTGIWMARAQDLKLLTREFWSQLLTILSYLNDLRSEMETLQWEFGNKMVQIALEVIGKRTSDSALVESFQKEWRGHKMRYENVTRTRLEGSPQLQEAIVTIAGLQVVSPDAHVDAIECYGMLVHECVSTFHAQHSSVDRAFEFFSSHREDSKSRAAFYKAIMDLRRYRHERRLPCPSSLTSCERTSCFVGIFKSNERLSVLIPVSSSGGLQPSSTRQRESLRR